MAVTRCFTTGKLAVWNSRSARLVVQSLLVRVQRVDTTLELGRSGSVLESDLSGINLLSELSDRSDTNVLETVLETSGQVGDELGDGTSVNNGSRDTLGNEHRVGLGEVSRSGSVVVVVLLLHGLDGAHTSVGLESLAVSVEVLTGGLEGSGKETSHHDGGSSEGNGLGDVANVLHTSVGNAGNAKLVGELGDRVDGGTLGSADSHDLLGDTDGAGAHSDSETVGTSLDQRSGLLSGNNVTGNNLQVGEGLLDPLDHLDLEDGVTLRRVEDDDIEASGNKLLKSLSVIGSGSDGSTTEELLGLGRLGGVGVVVVLLQIGQGQQSDEVALLVDNGELTLLGLLEQVVGGRQTNGLGGGDELSSGGHDITDGGVVKVEELNVSRGNDTDELARHASGFWVSFWVWKQVTCQELWSEKINISPRRLSHSVERKL